LIALTCAGRSRSAADNSCHSVYVGLESFVDVARGATIASLSWSIWQTPNGHMARLLRAVDVDALKASAAASKSAVLFLGPTRFASAYTSAAKKAGGISG